MDGGGTEMFADTVVVVKGPLGADADTSNE
jgi:hypothetical protein